MRSVDEFITSDDAIETCRKQLAPLLDERQKAERAGSCDVWARVSVPDSRAAWHQTLQTCAAAGATGVIVAADSATG